MTGKAYQLRPTREAERAWTSGHIEPWNLFRMLAWKSAKGVASLSVEDPEKIVAVTKRVISELRPYEHADAFDLAAEEATWAGYWDATYEALRFDTGLGSLAGVGLPSATAILALLNPRGWAVIDLHACNALFTPAPGPQHRGLLAVYRSYLEAIIAIAPHAYPGLPIHEVDQRLMALGKSGGDPPFERVPFVAPPRRRRRRS